MGRIAARLYDVMNAKFEKEAGADLRRRLLANVRGRVLEIGGGTGGNLAYYPDGLDEVVVTEPDKAMLDRARRKAVETGSTATLVQASAMELPFPDDSFDTVCCTVVLCTVPDPDKALAEIHRVLKPDGTFIFGEHIRSADPKLAKWQDRLEKPWGVLAGGCHPNRDTRAAMERAGFTVTIDEESELPIVPKLVKPYIAGHATLAGRP
jgi:ubiquinone/menaquinone biosynthesis C-methylase UbiE